MKTMKEMRKIIVHGGKFHFDDVLCVAIARYINPNIEVERSLERSFAEEDDVLVADTGRGRFDHHQADAALRPDGHKHAACGLVFDEFWREIYDSELFYRQFVNKYIIPIEDGDNGLASNMMSCYVAGMNPEWDSSDSTDVRFERAVAFAMDLLTQAVEHCKAVERAASAVHAGTKCGDVLVLTQDCPWQSEVMNNPEYADINFVVYPDKLRGGYILQVVPNGIQFGDRRKEFPDTVNTEAEGCTFVHANRFLAAFDTAENALACLVAS